MELLTTRELRNIDGGNLLTGSLQAGKVFTHVVYDFVNGFMDRFTLFSN